MDEDEFYSKWSPAVRTHNLTSLVLHIPFWFRNGISLKASRLRLRCVFNLEASGLWWGSVVTSTLLWLGSFQVQVQVKPKDYSESVIGVYLVRGLIVVVIGRVISTKLFCEISNCMYIQVRSDNKWLAPDRRVSACDVTRRVLATFSLAVTVGITSQRLLVLVSEGMSFSVPTSPAMSRSTKAQPVTPQRLPRQQPRSHTLYRSPLTPLTSPFTPPSLRSIDSTGSSTLSTPDNIGINVKKRLNFSVSLEGGHLSSAKDKSLADIADNWRSRANENGIKVSFSNDDSNYRADSCERIYLLYIPFY